jgi:hypothetical protein
MQKQLSRNFVAFFTAGFPSDKLINDLARCVQHASRQKNLLISDVNCLDVSPPAR